MNGAPEDGRLEMDLIARARAPIHASRREIYRAASHRRNENVPFQASGRQQVVTSRYRSHARGRTRLLRSKGNKKRKEEAGGGHRRRREEKRAANKLQAQLYAGLIESI